jgi:hypothetical protein
MTVPGLSPAGASLNLGGDEESDDERRKRLLALQQSRLLPNSSGYSGVFSAAGMSLGLGQNN